MSARLDPLLRDFFQEYLREQRNVSPNTIKSYRDTFKLLIAYLGAQTGGKRELAIEDLDAKAVLGFLRYIEDPVGGRGNCAHSRNARLAAIQSFFRYAALCRPELDRQAKRIFAVPVKRAAPRAADSLDRKELEALFAQPQTSRAEGVRDLAILAFLYNTGARAQEAADARLDWFDFPNRVVEITGKGQKRRTTPLWPSTVRLLKLYRERHRRKPAQAASGRLFINQRGGGFSRFGIRAIVKRHLRLAARVCPSIAKKRLSTHSMRHTTAVHLLQSRVDPNVIKAWLGHASISSTSRYLDTDLNHKRSILEKFGPPRYVDSPTQAEKPASAMETLDWLGEL